MIPPIRITFKYFVFGVCWILLTDFLLTAVSGTNSDFAFLQTMKGLVFVGISSGVIFILTRRAFVATQQEQQAREDIFRDTLQASQHILLNYLNQMQLVNLEAENCKDFDRETLRYSHALSDQAAKDLHRLAGIETMSPDALSEAIQTIARSNDSIGRTDTKTTSIPQTQRQANQAAQPKA